VRYNWLDLQNEFNKGKWNTLAEFAEAKGINLQVAYNNIKVKKKLKNNEKLKKRTEAELEKHIDARAKEDAKKEWNRIESINETADLILKLLNREIKLNYKEIAENPSQKTMVIPEVIHNLNKLAATLKEVNLIVGSSNATDNDIKIEITDLRDSYRNKPETVKQ
jgi:hypothetical protein